MIKTPPSEIVTIKSDRSLPNTYMKNAIHGNQKAIFLFDLAQKNLNFVLYWLGVALTASKLMFSSSRIADTEE
jgi:hypothetical protein